LGRSKKDYPLKNPKVKEVLCKKTFLSLTKNATNKKKKKKEGQG